MKSRAVLFLAILVPILIVFKAFIFSGNRSLVYGDAPYFTSEGLEELLSEPSSWTYRGNNFGEVNNLLWLSPLMLLYGFLHLLFDFGNELILIVLFYIPSILAALVGTLLFTRFLKLSIKVQFITCFFYVFNTFYLLIVDGGQVGIALAYGLFPFALLYLVKYLNNPSLNSFLLALVWISLVSLADPRYALIAIIFSILWNFWSFDPKKLLLLLIALFGINMYWVFPLIKTGGLTTVSSGMQLINFKHGLAVFQPHWPENTFGVITDPPIYFYGIFGLILLGVLLGKHGHKHKIISLYLVSLFLIKGGSGFLGNYYSWIINNFPFAVSFRDSTKFSAPLVLFSGILIGLLIEKINRKIFLAAVYLYLLFLLSPAIWGLMNGVLSGGLNDTDINNVIRGKTGTRSVWFPEKYPLAYETVDNQAINAKELVDLRPIASMNAGTYDKFNFLHNEKSSEWLTLLGINYLVINKPENINNNQREEWNNLLDLISLNKEFRAVSGEIYEITSPLPRLYAADRLLIVVGGDEIYSEVPKLADQAVVFVEDGKFDPRLLQGKEKGSAVLIFSGKKDIDLEMSFLQEYFISPNNLKYNWGYYSSDDYLLWKYQLLIRDLSTLEYDYGIGTLLSTNKNEEISYNFTGLNDGEYVLAIRQMAVSNPATSVITLDHQQWVTTFPKNSKFDWFTVPVKLSGEEHLFSLQNGEGSQVFNTVALIPKEEYDKAMTLAQTYKDHFGSIGGNELALEGVNSNWREIPYEKISPTWYKLGNPKITTWIVLTDSFHPMWQLKRGQVDQFGSFPAYSAVNAFYIEDDWRDLEIVFGGQKEFRWGVYYSALTILMLAIVFLYLKSLDRYN